MGDWVGPRTGLDSVEKRKTFLLPGTELRFLGHPARSLVAIPTELPVLNVMLLKQRKYLEHQWTADLQVMEVGFPFLLHPFITNEAMKIKSRGSITNILDVKKNLLSTITFH
jgi:hypothetical protein